ncbi:CPBP family intramembrane metalloprotease [Sphingomonas sp. CGMCC 1.13654]|uniref:CPBP family intramembrane metalloprotease n=1 Tax=Sphingomonas chungangi TaxID=2683589 RepID=A0A838L7I5_9SPHN|nr:CPBP family intramembrane glutamic endopeptidase [Sphingomonas chungangi]MBA2934665.1 CPBP family intramembrane metalloprotease [Sphingomonas chungangi]MVW57976.1 CPBP family intramembrane metalloprotease [Sphingomonas chungangi]
MTPGWLDHLYVVGVLLLFMPVAGWIAYRRFLARRERIGGVALVRQYRRTILWLIGLAGLAAWIWWIEGRPLAALITTPPVWPDGSDFATSLAIGGSIGLVARPVLAFVPAIGARFARQMRKLAPFLPQTGEQLAWGLLVSLAAGMCEEIAYRGYLVAYLGHWLSWSGVLAANAVIFGLGHVYQGKAGVVMTGIIGAGLGALYLASGSLLLPMLLHALFDVSAMVTAYIVLRDRA